MKRNSVQLLSIAGVFAALVFVFTAYLQFPGPMGYTHVGDGFIYLAACLLPMPYAMGVGAVGALLADCLTGYAVWAPASVIIKALTVVFFTRKTEKILSKRNLLALIPAGVLCIAGYYLYEAVLVTGSGFEAALAGVPGNIVQVLLSSAVFVIIGIVLDRIKIKERFQVLSIPH